MVGKNASETSQTALAWGIYKMLNGWYLDLLKCNFLCLNDQHCYILSESNKMWSQNKDICLLHWYTSICRNSWISVQELFCWVYKYIGQSLPLTYTTDTMHTWGHPSAQPWAQMGSCVVDCPWQKQRTHEEVMITEALASRQKKEKMSCLSKDLKNNIHI